LDLSTFLIVLSGKNKKMDFIFLTNDLIDFKFFLEFLIERNVEMGRQFIVSFPIINKIEIKIVLS
jgi:hypothetical protein